MTTTKRIPNAKARPLSQVKTWCFKMVHNKKVGLSGSCSPENWFWCFWLPFHLYLCHLCHGWHLINQTFTWRFFTWGVEARALFAHDLSAVLLSLLSVLAFGHESHRRARRLVLFLLFLGARWGLRLKEGRPWEWIAQKELPFQQALFNKSFSRSLK